MVLLIIPAVMIFGGQVSWDVGDRELKNFDYQAKLFLAMSGKSTKSSTESYSMKKVTYLLINNGISDLKTVTIVDDSRTGLSMDVNEHPLVGLFFILVFGFLFRYFHLIIRKGKANKKSDNQEL